MVDGEGNVLAQMIEGGNFGEQATDNFCVEATVTASLVAPTIWLAYDSNATSDDGSCVLPYDVVYIDEDGDGYGGDAIADWCPPLESWTVFQSVIATMAMPPFVPMLLAREKASTTTPVSSMLQKKPCSLS